MESKTIDLDVNSLKEFSKAEVAKHNSEESIWTIYKGLVVDVTNYLDDHPGGGNVVLDFAGIDCTETFEDTGHSDEAIQLTHEMVIGKVEGYEPEDYAEPEETEEKKGPNYVLFAGAAAALAASAYFVMQKKKLKL